ncbi:MAG: hypothetical protein ABFE08_02730 [Armatimonadia bacterium]
MAQARRQVANHALEYSLVICSDLANSYAIVLLNAVGESGIETTGRPQYVDEQPEVAPP